jgi:flagellar biosynthesis/type III secretory pathway protein FliH
VVLSWVFQEGVRKGKAEGRAEGKAEGKAEAILVLLAEQELAVSEAEREKIRGETDLPTLERWLKRAIGAKTTAEIFL